MLELYVISNCRVCIFIEVGSRSNGNLFDRWVFGSDVHMKLHEALVVSVDPSRWRPWFKEKGSRNVSSGCFQPFVEQRAPSRGLNRYN